MGFLYKLPKYYSLVPNEQGININYCSLKKKYDGILSFSDEIAIYESLNDCEEGIYTIGNIKGLYKSSEILHNKNINFLNRNYFQLKIEYLFYNYYPLVNLKYLKQFPSYNRPWSYKPYNPYKLYWDGGIIKSINDISKSFSIDYKNIQESTTAQWKYYIHKLREIEINSFFWWKLLSINDCCKLCGKKIINIQDFNIHDNTKIDFNLPYEPVITLNCVLLCHECHKKEHQKLNNE
jgi:hypothetical protein